MASNRASRSRASCYNDPEINEHEHNDIQADEPRAEEETIHDENAEGSRPKRKRGPTMGANLWSYTDAPKKIIYDTNGQHVGGDGNKLTTFLGYLARNGEFFPISTPTWSNMTEANMTRAWDEIQSQINNKEMDQADIYIASHTRSDESILLGASSNVEKNIELKKTQATAGESSSTLSTGRNDILAHVFGPERHGKLRQGGVGATATNTWGPRETNDDVHRENQELKAELKMVRDKGDDTARKVDKLQAIIAEMLKKSTVSNAQSNNQGRSTEEDNDDITGSNNHIEDL